MTIERDAMVVFQSPKWPMNSRTPRKLQNRSRAAERRFGLLLQQREYPYWTEMDLERRIILRATRPDFCFQLRNKAVALAEVKGFNRKRSMFLGRAGVSHLEPLLKPIRSAVEEAAEQLEPYRHDGVPALVILDSLQAEGVPLNVEYLGHALYGNPEYQITGDGTTVGPWRSHLGRGQMFHACRKRYVSAVAWNLRKVSHEFADPQADVPMRLRIVHNPFATNSLLLDTFADPEDEHWVKDRRGHWTRLK